MAGNSLEAGIENLRTYQKILKAAVIDLMRSSICFDDFMKGIEDPSSMILSNNIDKDMEHFIDESQYYLNSAAGKFLMLEQIINKGKENEDGEVVD